MDSIQKIPREENQYMSINYFCSVIMALEVTHFEDYYVKVLNKFEINK